MSKKDELLGLMNSMGFGIADISCIIYLREDEKLYYQEIYAHKQNDSEELAWFNIEQGGSGFERLFKGQIIRVLMINEGAKIE